MVSSEENTTAIDLKRSAGCLAGDTLFIPATLVHLKVTGRAPGAPLIWDDRQECWLDPGCFALDRGVLSCSKGWLRL